MRPLTTAGTLLLTISATTITALSLPTFNIRAYIGQTPFMSSLSSAQKQTPISPPSTSSQTTDSPLSISDILPQSKGINIFASLTRDLDSISSRLDDSTQNTTLLAPLNSAIQSLPRKPWEDEDEITAFAGTSSASEQASTETYHLGEGEERANRNLLRFVERHVIPASPWVEGEKVYTLGSGGGEKGKMLWWKMSGEDDGMRIVMPGGIKARVERRVGNGEVWILEGVVGK